MATIADTLIAAPSFSNFDLSRTWCSDYFLGTLIPSFVEELLPGDHVSVSASNDVWTAPLISPLLGSLDQELAFFFIPSRLYQQDMDINKRMFDIENVTYPTVIMPASDSYGYNTSVIPNTAALTIFARGVPAGSLLDYLGFAPGTQFGPGLATDSAARTFNAIPLIGYFDIFRNYYAAQEVDVVPFYEAEMSDGFLTYVESSFALTGLDDLIQSFVSQPGQEWNNACKAASVPTQWQTNFITAYDDSTGSSRNIYSIYGNKFCHLLFRCFRSDRLTSWLNQNTYSTMVNKAKINVTSSAITVNQIRMGSAILEYYEAGLLSGGRYDNWVYALFGVHTDQKLCIPELLSVSHSPIIFQDVINQSQTAASPLGSLGALGRGAMRPQRLRFTASEHGYLMGIYSIVPNVSYGQGIAPYLRKISLFDVASPKFRNIAFQPLAQYDMTSTTTISSDGQKILFTPVSEEDSIGVQPAYMEYQTAVNETHGQMVPGGTSENWAITRVFDKHRAFDDNGLLAPRLTYPWGNIRPAEIPWQGEIINTSPYALPSSYRIPFAVQDLSAANIWIKFNYDVFVRRCLTKHNMPKLA